MKLQGLQMFDPGMCRTSCMLTVTPWGLHLLLCGTCSKLHWIEPACLRGPSTSTMVCISAICIAHSDRLIKVGICL